MFFLFSWAAAQQPADTVYLNGRLWTADAARSWATALAIQDGKLVYVGSDPGVSPFIANETTVVDLEGRAELEAAESPR